MSEGHDEILMHSNGRQLTHPNHLKGIASDCRYNRFYFWTMGCMFEILAVFGILRRAATGIFFTLDYSKKKRGNFSRYFDVFCTLCVSDSSPTPDISMCTGGVSSPLPSPLQQWQLLEESRVAVTVSEELLQKASRCPSASSKSSKYIIHNRSKYNNSEPATMNYTRSFKDIQATSSPSSNTLSSICRHQRSY